MASRSGGKHDRSWPGGFCCERSAEIVFLTSRLGNFGLSGFGRDDKVASVTPILFLPGANSSWIRSKTCVLKGAEFQPNSR